MPRDNGAVLRMELRFREERDSIDGPGIPVEIPAVCCECERKRPTKVYVDVSMDGDGIVLLFYCDEC